MQKKGCVLIVIALASALLIAYFYAFFQQGIWYRDAFLYRQHDGSFAGSDHDAKYTLHITPFSDGAEILFTVNDTAHSYRVVTRNGSSETQIYEDDALVYDGTAVEMGDSYFLADKEGDFLSDVQVWAGSEAPPIGSLFPNYDKLYHWAAVQLRDTRGNLFMLVPIGILAAVLILDIRYPEFFFLLRHGLAVDGGEPSDWYRTTQKFSRWLLAVLLFGCMAAGFWIH